ncbi:MAG: alpha/beta hydrolase [Defluviitaleaceae bacterium]|nr:alpha/beta hydrolase [Defluviitaleaceae bacterium]
MEKNPESYVINQREINYTSADNETRIFAYIWEPNMQNNEKPKGILQISHDFAEHARRYEELAKFYAGLGYIVCANDHIGHGKSAKGNGNIGHKFLAKDVYRMSMIIKKEFNLPVVLIGFGVGSLIARYVACLWGMEYNGVVFCGTSSGNRIIDRLAAIVGKIKSKESRHREPKWFNSISERRNSRTFADENWRTSIIEEQEIYANDPFCGAPLTYGGLRDLIKLNKIVNSRQWFGRIPKNLPIYLLSGLEDPIGDFGRGVLNIYMSLVVAGCANVEVKLYEDCRHEPLFDIAKEEAADDINEWLDEILS